MILCSGCFDGLHVGHLRYLQAAKALHPTRSLCVAVASDEYIRTHKGREPQWLQGDRLAVVFALSIVDRVILHGVDGATESILDLRPYAFVKGADWATRVPADLALACRTVGTRLLFVDSGIRKHSSDALSPVIA